MSPQENPGFRLKGHEAELPLRVMSDNKADTPVTEVAVTVEENYRMGEPGKRGVLMCKGVL